MSRKEVKKIKVVHLISSLKIGGAEAILVDLIRTLHNQHYEHYVVYFHQGEHVHHLKNLGIQTYLIKGLLCRYDVIFFVRLYRLVRNIFPDVIHSSLWAANFLARILGLLLHIPVICAIHLGVETDGVLRNIFDRFTLFFADRIVAISENVAQSLYDRPSWIKQSKILVIKNGIDKEYTLQLKNQLLQRRCDYNLHDQHIVLGSVGRFIPRKNFSMLLEVFKLLYNENKDMRLVLVGQGPQEKELRFLIHSLAIEETVIFVTGQRAYGYYALMDIFVLPSFQEGLSIALLEAMSCALPSIVTYNEKQHHDVIQNYHNGILVSTCKKELVSGIKCIINDTFLRAQLGRNAQKTVEQNFSIHSTAQAYVQLYKNLYYCKNQ